MEEMVAAAVLQVMAKWVMVAVAAPFAAAVGREKNERKQKILVAKTPQLFRIQRPRLDNSF
jgi:hypothetical protein